MSRGTKFNIMLVGDTVGKTRFLDTLLSHKYQNLPTIGESSCFRHGYQVVVSRCQTAFFILWEQKKRQSDKKTTN